MLRLRHQRNSKLDTTTDKAASGITSFAEAANAVQIAYGFGYDLSVFLSALGVVAGGDLITGKYTIGGRRYSAWVRQDQR